MGQGSWTGLNDETFLEYERRMLLHSKLPIEAFDIKNIEIDNNYHIRTIQVGDRT